MNTGAVKEAEKHTVFAARLTQRGHEIHSMDDLLMLYEKAYTENTLERITTLPHPTVQKFAVITGSSPWRLSARAAAFCLRSRGTKMK